VFAVAVGLLVGATWVWSSGDDMFIGLLLVVVVGGWGLLALERLVGLVRAVRAPTPGWLRSWAVGSVGCLVALVGAVGVCATGAPEDVRIRLSRHALVDAGERVLAGEHPERAGLYGLGDTRIVGDCALLETGTFMISSFGFAYCPAGAPARYQPVGGPLYEYTFD